MSVELRGVDVHDPSTGEIRSRSTADVACWFLDTAWASIYSTTSRPFLKPGTVRIAVKVINHYGDEVLKVVDVE